MGGPAEKKASTEWAAQRDKNSAGRNAGRTWQTYSARANVSKGWYLRAKAAWASASEARREWTRA
jgi:hypothetical protein